MAHASVISELRRLRQVDGCEFQASLSSSMRQNDKMKEVNEEMLDALWAGRYRKIRRKQE